MSDATTTIEATATTENPAPWADLAEGDYAIVEFFGHTTLVGRINEVERFGAKMMAIEIVFGGKLLEPVYHGGAAIYRLSPCSRQTAWERGHKEAWQLPPAIRAVLPPELLPAPGASMRPADQFLDDADRGEDY